MISSYQRNSFFEFFPVPAKAPEFKNNNFFNISNNDDKKRDESVFWKVKRSLAVAIVLCFFFFIITMRLYFFRPARAHLRVKCKGMEEHTKKGSS